MCQHWRIATTSPAVVDQTVQPLPASQAVDNQLYFLQRVAEPWPSAEDGGEEGVTANALPSVSSIRHCTKHLTGLSFSVTPALGNGHYSIYPQIPVEDTRVSAGYVPRFIHKQQELERPPCATSLLSPGDPDI